MTRASNSDVCRGRQTWLPGSRVKKALDIVLMHGALRKLSFDTKSACVLTAKLRRKTCQTCRLLETCTNSCVQERARSGTLGVGPGHQWIKSDKVAGIHNKFRRIYTPTSCFIRLTTASFLPSHFRAHCTLFKITNYHFASLCAQK